jgi:hypothetical protein
VCPVHNTEGPLSFTSSASEPLQERECCLLEVSSTTSAAQHMLRSTRHPLPFLLFRAAAAGKRRRSGEAEREWDRLDLTHFLFFPWCACYACTLLNSRTRQFCLQRAGTLFGSFCCCVCDSVRRKRGLFSSFTTEVLPSPLSTSFIVFVVSWFDTFVHEIRFVAGRQAHSLTHTHFQA